MRHGGGAASHPRRRGRRKMRKSKSIGLVLALFAVMGGSFYWLLLPGLSVADREPSPMEMQIATWLLHQSVPDAQKIRANPLGPHPDAAAVAAGRDLFR